MTGPHNRVLHRPPRAREILYGIFPSYRYGFFICLFLTED